MRYADGPTTEVQTRVDADPAAVWAWVGDIRTPCRFSEELREVRWLDADRFVGHSAHPAIGEWETTCTVVAREPGRELAWVVGDPDHPSASWRFTLQPDGAGTVLRQWMRMGPAPSGLTIAITARPDKEERIVARRLEEHRANMQRTVDGIRQLAESGQQPPGESTGG
ncbi:SRPBCC family protein [Modestobacter sp. I12A-02628]|uniref:SRPBCC family protein n=1 Tax=Goekera deserti TaxID=2497753 RepID=A0A7K3WGB0_9ACTN|nr:SRPBCC family protein [Goekera deserti]MPQ96614.1 SRPBCC family protein [Goekera deserti]NDI47074.1 SRPBCC family protein [Goekera deserti]NEL55528.1 SRPBCC family protein [Goekera deserti]